MHEINEKIEYISICIKLNTYRIVKSNKEMEIDFPTSSCRILEFIYTLIINIFERKSRVFYIKRCIIHSINY